ncbi:hypothetical protein GX50_06015 [[Emmonsia] crescens]|uniref:Uncharacterized protein n=1 Tax=[Emmonsia] crescens TaxID=73230 RepID=A0A2B7ZCZ5_9EURO|nr:hypothetical protein GX50_06015 [Emmonsia crescens]
MEPSASLSIPQESPGMARHNNGFRSRAGSFFSGTSTTGAPNARSASQTRIPRIGLRLFSGERNERPRPRQSDYASGYRRPRASYGSSIVPNVPTTRPAQPFAPSSIEMAEAGLSGGHLQAQGHVNSSRHNRPQPNPRARPGNFSTWVRRKHDDKSKPKRFCGGPGMRSKEVRKKLVDCSLAGFLLLTIFIIYLALSLSNTVSRREFHVVLILVLMILVIYFCHSFIRFFMLASRPAPGYPPPSAPRRVGTLGYAQPDQPIPVILARDEEIAREVDTNNNTSGNSNLGGLAPPPPAYGLWRNSVKINPNLVHWQRRGQIDSQRSTENENTHDGPHRPPSYISDDGVHYVVDVQPRSQAAVTVSRQPQSRLLSPNDSDIHPAERLRRKQ